MNQIFTPKIGRPKTTEATGSPESVAVTPSMREELRILKNRGLLLGDMTREFWAEIIRQARSGGIGGITLPDKKRSA